MCAQITKCVQRRKMGHIGELPLLRIHTAVEESGLKNI